MKKLKQIYLAEQTRIAEPFLKRGLRDLATARIEEAIRVSKMNDEDFIDYVGDEWINSKTV